MQDSCNNEIDPLHISLIKKVTWGGMIVNLLLAGIKFLVGILGSSQAVVADAVHSVSDITTDIAVLFGVKFWSAPPDSSHPYGHQRIEELVTLAIGLALVSVAVGLAYNSLVTIREEHFREIGWVAITGPVISIAGKEALYRWSVNVGTRVKSSAVVANAWHHRSDVLSSVPALAAVLIASLYPDWNFVDHIGAVIIACFILKVAWDIMIPALKGLSDTGASVKTQAHLRKLIMSVDGVKNTHAIRTREFGSRLFVDLHVLVDPEISVRSGHHISECVKEKLLDSVTEVVDVIVHLEPCDDENRKAE